MPDREAFLLPIGTNFGRLTTSLAFGYKTAVIDHQIDSVPIPAVEFHDGVNSVVCKLESPAVLPPMLRKKGSTLRGELRSNPLFRVGKKTNAVELSILNAGTIFDIELPAAWNTFTGQLTESDTLWAYILN